MFFPPIMRSFMGPGSVGRGLDSVSQAKTRCAGTGLCCLPLPPVASRGLPWPPVPSRGIPWPPVYDGTDDIYI